MGASSLLGRSADDEDLRSPAREGKNESADGEMTIGEVAREFGVTLRTLRFYEDRRLIRPRRLGNARFYGGADRVRLAMILKGKQLGFTLAEIGDLIGMEDAAGQIDIEERLRPAQIVDQLDHLERQREEIDAAIARLKATRERLSGIGDAV
jgi:DNA-binding transcriptional MerR regulator